MPIYTYHCDNCGLQFERNQRFTDSPLTWCPECGVKALRKVYTPVGIVFKGSGFYATDHRSPSGTSRTKSDISQEKSSEEKSSTKDKDTSTSTKPETTKEE